MEARIIYGKNINMDAARYYQMIGRTDLLFGEILKQAGGLSEFTSKLPFQQQSFAKALGMSVDELTEILTKQQNIRDLGFDISDTSLSVLELRKKLNGEYSKEQKLMIQEEIRRRRSLSLMETLANAWEKFQDVILGPLIEPINNVINELVKAFDQGSNGAFGTAMTALQDFVKNNASGLIDKLAEILKLLPEFLTKSLNKLTEIMSGDMRLFETIGKAIGKGMLISLGGSLTGMTSLLIGMFGAEKGVVGISKSYNRKPGLTDTIPIMTAPGESIINSDSTSKNPRTLKYINSGGNVDDVLYGKASLNGTHNKISEFDDIGVSKLNRQSSTIIMQQGDNSLAQRNHIDAEHIIKRLIDNINIGVDVYMDGDRMAEKVSDSLYRIKNYNRATGLQHGM